MTKRPRAARGSAVFVALAVALLVRPLRAADGPLLVVVEAPPALEADAVEIRRVIGSELHKRTVAPMSTPAEAPGRALIVALDHDRIAISLRASDGTSVTRVIPAPAEHAARLRAIAWLAGNLARDQVSPILAEAPAEPTPLATIPAPPSDLPATEPPPAATASPAEQPASSNGAPPPRPLPPTDVAGAISLRTEPHESSGPLLWSVSGSVGPVIAAFDRGAFEVGSFTVRIHDSTAWQLEVQRRRTNGHLVIGGAFEGTHSNRADEDSPKLLGVNILVGAAWHFRFCSMEATIAGGPEAASTMQYATVPVGNQLGTFAFYSYSFALYAKGAVAAAIPLGDSIEGLLQLGFHVTSTREESWFGASTIGVRYLLP